MAAPWHLTLYKLHEMQVLCDYGSQETIAIIDTGGAKNHPEFEEDRVVHPKSFVRTSRGDWEDQNGHGLATA